MAAVQTQMLQGLSLSKAERKMLRKQKKALCTMKTKVQEVGEISESSTPYLLVKNGGLMCGIKRCDLFDIMKGFGVLENIVMLAGKSYSYALFSSVESAKKAMANLNGKQILNDSSLRDKTLYLAYLLKKPCVEMRSLNTCYPPGLLLVEDFIDKKDATLLLNYFSNSIAEDRRECLPGLAPVLAVHGGASAEKQLRHRYVKHYGYEFLYRTNTVDLDKPLPNGIPSVCLPVLDKLTSLEYIKHRPDQLTINEYLPGQGIPPHIDTHSAFEDGIICLSLGAKVAMEFRHPDGRHVSVLLPKRSLLIMTKDSRYIWTHGITPRKYDVINEDSDISDTGEIVSGDVEPAGSQGVTILPREIRLSLTFRKVRTTPCDCKFPSVCDSRRMKQGIENSASTSDTKEDLDNCPDIPTSEKDAVDLEKKHVYNVYENIAEHFSGTRHSPWPKIAEFLEKQAPGSLVADVGCGNGKYLGINNQLFMSGSDRSFNLASICRDRGFQVLVCDILRLPYRSDAFDVCICIAVIHHLSTPARRHAAIKELARIVRPGGRILISVWALEQNLNTTGAMDEKEKHLCNLMPVEKTGVKMPDARFSGDISPVCNTQQQTTMVDAKCQGNISSEMSSKLKVNKTRNKFEQQDLLVPWHYRGEKKTALNNVKNEVQKRASSEEVVFQRFYHVFTENELDDDCRKLADISIIRSYYDRGNWCVELQKTAGNND